MIQDNDRLHRFIIETTNVRGETVHLNATWQAILERADYPDNVKRILGEALAACALLAATIKFDGSLILQIRGNGPLHLLVAQTTSTGAMRAIARWNDEVPDHGLANIFGDGQMVMTIEPNKGEPYQGIIALQGEHLNNAIEAYFQQSEQLNTRLWLACDNETCGGFLIQELPGKETDDEDSWQRTVHLSSTLTENELLHVPVEELLHRLFHENDVRLFEAHPMCFRCSCSKERISSVLLSLGSDEVHDILQEQGSIEVDCEFCNAHYEFDSVDIDALFADTLPAPHSKTQH